MNKPELLAPAGNLEKMKVAFAFGADAVYFGLPDFSLRVRINQFGEKELFEAAEYCKKINKKFYITLNIYAHDSHLKKIDKYFELLKKLKPDALIVSDPGILVLVKKQLGNIPIHLSTQANACNSEALRFWKRQGVERVILARELSLDEISEMKKGVNDLELETFVHGAMCMAYSGRCILSQWMAGRSANLGDCAQPCRWKFSPGNRIFKEESKNNSLFVTLIDDKERFNLDIEEDIHGTHFFNSCDLNMIEHVDRLCETGLDSLKIEGRAKSVYYLAVVVRAYRQILDAVYDLKNKKINKNAYDELMNFHKKQIGNLSSRSYWTGFYFGDNTPHLFDQASLDMSGEFVGISMESASSKHRNIFVHNALCVGDKLEVIGAEGNIFAKVLKIESEKGDNLKSAHGGLNKIFNVSFDTSVKGWVLLRKKN